MYLPVHRPGEMLFCHVVPDFHFVLKGHFIIRKYINAEVLKHKQGVHTNTQIHKYTNIQIHKYTNTQIHKYKNTKIYNQSGQPVPHVADLSSE